MQYIFLVVDDERLSRDYIKDLLLEFQPTATVIEASSAKKALAILDEIQPDILFLDINMPGIDGFGMLSSIQERDFELVFITAYSQYAIQAIKEGASDYLLKPIKKPDFKTMLDKVLKKRADAFAKRNATTNSEEHVYLNSKIVINHLQGIKFILIRNIIYLKADNTYTTLYMAGGEKMVTSKPIHRFEKMLSPAWFFRVHKSFMINLHHFKEYVSRNGSWALMDNGEKILVSRYRLNEFLDVIKDIPGDVKI